VEEVEALVEALRRHPNWDARKPLGSLS
jgi:hypothetical protein